MALRFPADQADQQNTVPPALECAVEVEPDQPGCTGPVSVRYFPTYSLTLCHGHFVSAANACRRIGRYW